MTPEQLRELARDLVDFPSAGHHLTASAYLREQAEAMERGAVAEVPEGLLTDEMVVRGAEYLHDAGIRFGSDDDDGDEQCALAEGLFRAMRNAYRPAAPEDQTKEPK